MVLQNYQKFIELTSNMIYIVALGGGFKCPRKIHLNTQNNFTFLTVKFRITSRDFRLEVPCRMNIPLSYLVILRNPKTSNCSITNGPPNSIFTIIAYHTLQFFANLLVS